MDYLISALTTFWRWTTHDLVAAQRGGRWQGAVLFALSIIVSLAVLAAADAWMITKDGAQRCVVQLPKWLGCVVANHESLSGSLITAGVAFFAARAAWNAVLAQIDSTVRPLAYIALGDYDNRVFVKVVNNGAGPMIIKSITINDSPQRIDIACGKRYQRIFAGDTLPVTVQDAAFQRVASIFSLIFLRAPIRTQRSPRHVSLCATRLATSPCALTTLTCTIRTNLPPSASSTGSINLSDKPACGRVSVGG